MPNDNNSLAHTTQNRKYHIVFAPKYRRKIFYGEHKAEIGKILRELCDWKGIHIVEAEVCPDHIHVLAETPPKESVAGFMGFLKGKSSILNHERHRNLKYKYGNRSFWCRGYYVDTAGKNTKKIAEYIQNQLKEDELHGQLTLKEYTDPFTGSKQQSPRRCQAAKGAYNQQRLQAPLAKPPAMPWMFTSHQRYKFGLQRHGLPDSHLLQ